MKHLNADGFELVGGPAVSNKLGEVEVEGLGHGVQVGQHQSLDVRVTHLDGVVKFFQTFFR